MPDYLSVPQHRRDRATHPKARSLRPGELRWIRSYVDDLYDPAVFEESLFVRYLDFVLVALASKHGWIIPRSSRWLAAQIGLRPSDVGRAVTRLIELRRFDLLAEADVVPDGLQLRFPQATLFEQERERSSSDRRAIGERSSSDRPAIDERHAAVSAQINDALGNRDPLTGPQTRARAEEEKSTTSNGTVSRDAAALAHAIEDDREIVNRLAALAARGNPKSAAVIRHWSTGAPEAIIARTLESFRGRHPRPDDPGAYVVGTLQALRREAGIPDPPRIEREPELR